MGKRRRRGARPGPAPARRPDANGYWEVAMDSVVGSWIAAMGAWAWFVVAAVFLLLELLSPGVFMLWLGLAAILIGIISLVAVLSWQAQLIGFAILSIV